MNWFNNERLKCLLTFPVESLSLLNDGEKFLDEEWADFASEMYSKGHSFFVYTSDSVDSLASCCRLRNGITENQFSYTLGAGGIATGSKCVVTMDLNRLVQNLYAELVYVDSNITSTMTMSDWFDVISAAVDKQVKKIHKYLLAFNENLLALRNKHMITIYDAGFISPEKQYLTVGINGFTEAAEYLGIDIKDSDTYQMFAEAVLKPIYNANKAAKTKDIMFNTEMVPAENLGVKFAKWDKKAGFKVPRDCYNSYFYLVEDTTLTPFDKLKLHGKAYTQYLDGGSACHINLEEHLTKAQYRRVLNHAIKTGCNYFTFNIPNTICNDCGYISKHKLNKCPKCGSENLDYATRVNNCAYYR